VGRLLGALGSLCRLLGGGSLLIGGGGSPRTCNAPPGVGEPHWRPPWSAGGPVGAALGPPIGADINLISPGSPVTSAGADLHTGRQLHVDKSIAQSQSPAGNERAHQDTFGLARARLFPRQLEPASAKPKNLTAEWAAHYANSQPAGRAGGFSRERAGWLVFGLNLAAAASPAQSQRRPTAPSQSRLADAPVCPPPSMGLAG